MKHGLDRNRNSRRAHCCSKNHHFPHWPKGGDGQERGQGALSAVQELKQSLGIPVATIIQLNDLIDILEESDEYAEYLEPVVEYRRKYGVLS